MGLELTFSEELRGCVRYIPSALDEAQANVQRFCGGAEQQRLLLPERVA